VHQLQLLRQQMLHQVHLPHQQAPATQVAAHLLLLQVHLLLQQARQMLPLLPLLPLLLWTALMTATWVARLQTQPLTTTVTHW
jgi:hypothetical protein